MILTRTFRSRADTETGAKNNMINPVSSAPVASQPVVPQNAKPQQASSSSPQDSVQLSAQAQAHASGDVDHDGDSH
jgi:anti-sigma28 factor (negative regulator of flagellin synthesis)